MGRVCEAKGLKRSSAQDAASVLASFCCNFVLARTMNKGFDRWIPSLLSVGAFGNSAWEPQLSDDYQRCWHYVINCLSFMNI